MIKMPASTNVPPDPPLEMGEVVEVADGHVQVRPHRHNACSSCGSTSLCFPESQPAPMIEARCDLEVMVGDLVEIGRQSAPRLGAAFTLFGVPVITTVGGVMAGMNATGQETQGAIAGAISGLLVGIFVIRTVNRFVAARGTLEPKVERVVSHATQTP